ncbi:MAG: NAD-dependent epimerase/dehydratase family protein [Candidatus Magasanikiibacteriota bacterium]
MTDKNFWFGKRVLVTGGDGFVASHLVKFLLTRGAVVVVTVRHKRPISTLRLILEEDNKEHFINPDIEECDLLDFYSLRRVCDRHQIDTIFHLAASAIVVDAANSPVSTVENNVMGTLNILEVARINKIPRVLVVSSDKAYGDHTQIQSEQIPYLEKYSLRGLDVYSASKVCTDVLAQTYSFQFKVPVIVARACNIYGPGDLNFSRLIPKTIMALLSGKSPIINQGNELVLREYIYVEDVVNAYLSLLEKVQDYYGVDNCNMPKSGVETFGWAAFNVGNYEDKDLLDIKKCNGIKSVSDIIHILRGKIADVEPIVKEKHENFIEIPDQYLDSSKIFKIGFRPQVDFEEGLDRSIEWYKNNKNYLEKIAHKYLNT